MTKPILIKGAIYYADPVEGSIWHDSSVCFIPGYVEYLGYDTQALRPVFKFRSIRYFGDVPHNPARESTWNVAANSEALNEFLGDN